MRRRELLQLATRVLAAGALAGCAPRLRRGASVAGPLPAAGAATPGAVAAAVESAAAFHAARRFAVTRFGRIAYVERGRGDVALFLHGFPLNGFQWRGALARLAGERRCLAPDFLGLGYSEVAPGQAVTPRAQMEMLIELLDQLGIDTVDVVANDSGGAVAQLLTAYHTGRVRSLLLTNCDVEPDSPPRAVLPVIAQAHAGTFADETFLPQLADKAFARSARGIGGLCFSDPAHPTDEAIDCYFTPLVASPARKALTNAYAIGLERNPLAGLEPLFRHSGVPTRIVWGTGDTIFAQSSADYLARLFPRARGVRRVPGAKLFFPEEYPDLIAAEARRLWSSV
jgi:haloalkane dehalogenase